MTRLPKMVVFLLRTKLDPDALEACKVILGK